MKTYDAIILGAGAAGLFCAMRASQLGKKVLILEKARHAGAKILISGGGRCNFTNRYISPEKYLSENKHFCVSALKTYTQHDFLALVDKHQISYHEKTLGQLFCDGSSQQILDMLLVECQAAGAEIRSGVDISAVEKSAAFSVLTNVGNFSCHALVLATGGLSIPKMGATSLSYDIARQFGLPLTELAPALVPLTCVEPMLGFVRELAGVSLPVAARIDKITFSESMVFTHRGLSGPAILQISSYWRDGSPVTLNLLPGKDLHEFLTLRKLQRPKAELKTILGEVLPHRLAESLTSLYFENAPIGSLSAHALKLVADTLTSWSFLPNGSEGYGKAEVTRGGVSTHALSSKTMEAVTTKGLYVVGEAVDVTGWLGGYNFQWAWSSGWAAGSALARVTAL